MSRRRKSFNPDETVRYSVYMTHPLDDALNELTLQTNIRKNSLLSLAVSKLLMDFGMINFDKEVVDILKELRDSTAKTLKKVSVGENEKINSIERIAFKGQNNEKIRFGHYTTKKGLYRDNEHIQGGEEKLIHRPFEITEKELLILLKSAFNGEVFSNEFQEQLKLLLKNV
ncbi:hypothetical protein [Neobacillus sp. SAB-20_R2A]|uniref:hypothetical protein n=1 Tax=Neobacillus sp. SAB-20_R2A TaxID=3120519 RepID=UPI003C6E6023